MNGDEIKKQWHGPFCSAMRLELRENREDVDFNNEYNLSSKPMQIDLLIIKKMQDVIIENEIGKIFRGHNILEYKSPGDSLNIDTYFKVLGYACFYKSDGEIINAIDEADVTISFVREGYPRELMKYFQKSGFTVDQSYPGIYYVHGSIFPIQVIVSGKLDQELHLWLTALTRNMEKVQAENLVLKMSSLLLKTEMENANSVLNLAMSANPELFQRVKEENPMCEALLRLMKPEMDAAISDNTDIVQAQAVDNIIKKLGKSPESACQIIGISPEKYRTIKNRPQQKSTELPQEVPEPV